MPNSDSQKLLTAKIAKRFLEDEFSADLSEFTAIEDAAAEILSQHQGDLFLDGLTSLSDAAAAALAKHQGDLELSTVAQRAVTRARERVAKGE